MLKKILLVLGVLLVAFLAFVATRPDDFQVQRSTHIDAPAAVVFANVNEFPRWAAWSPWEKLDPAMQKEFSGPAAGSGAAYAWKSENDNVGEGRMTILESRPAEFVGIKLDFITPFEATNDIAFSFNPMDGGTHVTWNMSGKNGFAGKLMHVFMDMDKMVGGDFEKGLADLKRVSEGQAQEMKAAAMAAPATAPGAATSPAAVTAPAK